MSVSQTKLIVGLGNPGKKYESTRHNLGFLVLRHFARQHHFMFAKSIFLEGFLADGEVDDHRVFLFLPATSMNQSGLAVKAVIKRKRIELQNLLVICDDIDLEFGQLRLRSTGSDGGHKGLRSLIEYLNTEKFARLRCGVGRPQNRDEVTDYVLSGFDRKEKRNLNGFIQKANDCCCVWVKEGTLKAMNVFNERSGDE